MSIPASAGPIQEPIDLRKWEYHFWALAGLWIQEVQVVSKTSALIGPGSPRTFPAVGLIPSPHFLLTFNYYLP